MGVGVTAAPPGSATVGVSHDLVVIGTGAAYLPAGNLHNLGVNHHLGVNGKRLPTSQQGTHLTWVGVITLR